VGREGREQAVGAVFATDQVSAGGDGGGQQAMGDGLGHDVGDAHRKALLAGGRVPGQGFLQIAAEGEDLVGIAKHHGAGLGEHDALPAATKELLAERLFQLPQLLADGGLRQAKLLGRARHAARASGRPEVAKMVVVQPRHDPSSVKPILRAGIISWPT
jgi:hypothetical protein